MKICAFPYTVGLFCYIFDLKYAALRIKYLQVPVVLLKALH